MFLKILALFGAIITINAMVTFDNYKVYNLMPKTDEQVDMLNEIREVFDFWTDIIAKDNVVRIMVSSEREEELFKYTDSAKIELELSIGNVQELVDAQMQPASTQRSATHGSFSWDRYHTLEEIHAYLDELQEMYPDIVTVVNIGISNEGRDLKTVIIDFKPGQRGNRPLVGMIEGGIHAREWISPATVTWIIKEFLTSEESDVRHMAEAFIWHIIPVLNPDGYIHTFTTNRMWRKNRNFAYTTNCTSDPTVDNTSNGIDLNRNFNYLWMTIGASANPCTETFAGPSPASEPETRALENYVLTLIQSGDVIYYISFHSYSQLILVPYSHASGQGVLEASNYGDMYEVAVRGVDALRKRHNTDYIAGTSAEILYPVSGSSFDWVKGSTNIPMVYLFELRDRGQFGFLLPTDEIVPNNEEIMDCLIEMDKTTSTLGYYSYSGTNSMFASIIMIILGLSYNLLIH